MLFQMVMRIMIFHFGFTLILVADGPHEGHIRSSQAQSFPHKKLKSIAWVRRPFPREKNTMRLVLLLGRAREAFLK